MFFQGQWGLTAADEEEESKRRVEFLKHVIPSTRAQLTVLAQSYQVIYTVVGRFTLKGDNSALSHA